MKIGIVSDTHDNIEKAEAAADFFGEEEVGIVVHCGDMVAPFTAELFDRGFEFHAVRGNNDGEWNLREAVEGFGVFHGEVAELEFEGSSIAFYHGTEETIVDGLASRDYDYVFRGHTHEKSIRELDGSIIVNPGGIRLPGQDEEFHVAVLDLKTGEVEFHHVHG
ncbi:MAG: metallophosphoesterase [Candidatus Nanohaloarchaea archaeon]